MAASFNSSLRHDLARQCVDIDAAIAQDLDPVMAFDDCTIRPGL
jgi:hypothetical protein